MSIDPHYFKTSVDKPEGTRELWSGHILAIRPNSGTYPVYMTGDKPQPANKALQRHPRSVNK